VSDALLAVFRDEAAEGLERLSRLLLELETTREGGPERVRELFRLAHSLKGAASTVGRRDLAQVAHELESVLDSLRRGELKANKRLIDGALVAVDMLSTGLERALQPADLQAVTSALSVARPLKVRETHSAAAPAPTDRSIDELRDALLPALSEARGEPQGRAAMVVLLEELMAREELQQSVPLLAVAGAMIRSLRAPEGEGDAARQRFGALVQAVDLLQIAGSGDGVEAEAELVLQALMATETAGITDAAAAVATSEVPTETVETLRVPVSLLDSILYRVDELVSTKLRLDHSRRSVEGLQTLVSRRRSEFGALAVELDRRLETLRRSLSDDVHGLGLLSQALQDEVRDVRMVQIGPLLEPFRRTIRDTAEALGKQVRLVLQGEGVRVDKRLFDLAKEPLTHLLRNAVDHGIEDPRRRLIQGKDEVGTVRIVASSHESQLFLEVGDDGNGIDVAAVFATAIKAGLVPAGTEPDEKQALELIFQPGFSTSASATTISGRGVGLDVVRVNVARLGGRVDLETTAGVGSRFVMALPLTLAEAGGLFVRVGRVTYCLPLSAVEEVRVVAPADVGLSQGQLFAKLPSGVTRYAALADALGGRPAAIPSRPSPCVVLSMGEQRAALGVDELIGQHEVVVKGLAPGTPRLALVAGATTLADGTLVTVLEPAAVLAALKGSASAETSSREAPARVLVVDDTLTTRAMVASVLERAGYEALVSPDGEAAWLKLNQEPGIRLLVTDVDMPLLDGLGLTRRVRGNPQFQTLPIVLLTSLGSPGDRALGAEAGATAYVVKTDFDPAAFLNVVQDVLKVAGS
jgi:two-component system chemotaxis sensor kinase CheA